MTGQACSGQERHWHFRLDDGAYVWHSHQHTARPGDFNRLHHHKPQEHDGMSLEDLRRDESVGGSYRGGPS